MYVSRLQYALAVLMFCAAAAPSLADDAEKSLAVAQAHYTHKHWQEAIQAFSQFVHEYPGHAEQTKARFLLGRSLLQADRAAEAYKVLVDLLADEPASPLAKEALFDAAEAAMRAGKTDEAKVRLLQFKSQYPHDRLKAYVLTDLAEMAMQSNDSREAEQLFRESLELFGEMPTADRCRYGLMRILQARHDLQAADQLLHDLAENAASPWAETALLAIAGDESSAGDHQGALDRYDSIISRFSKSPLIAYAQLGCGRELCQMERYGEAIQVLSAIAAPDELKADVRYFLALAEKAQQKATATATDGPTLAAPQIGQETSDKETLKMPSTEDTSTSVLIRQDSGIGAGSKTAQEHRGEPTRSETSVEIKLADERQVAARAEHNRRRSAAIRYHAAEEMIRAGQFSQAVTTLQIGDNSGEDPDSLGNRYLLIVALQGDGRQEEALEALSDLYSILERNQAAGSSAKGHAPAQAASDRPALAALCDQVQIALAHALFAKEQFNQATAPLKAYLSKPRTGEQDESPRAMLAQCLARSNQPREAYEALRGLKSDYPDNATIVSTSLQVAEAAYAAGLWELAGECFADLTADGKAPDLAAKGLYGLAWSSFKAGRYHDAEQAFSKFLDRFPNESGAPAAALARAQALEYLERDDDAKAAYGQALTRYRDSNLVPRMLANLARLHDQVGDDEQAIALYRRLVNEHPKSDEADAALYGWAWALRDLGQGPQSEKIFRTLHDQFPKSRFWADATYRLAERSAQRGDHAAADGFLKELLAGDCPPAVLEHVLYLQAQMAIAQRAWPAAQAPLERLIHDFPAGRLCLPADFWLAEAAYRNGDYETARQRFDSLADRVHDVDETWVAIVPLRRAQILARNERWTDARKLAETIAHDYPQFEQHYEVDYVIGRCLLGEGAFNGAREALRRVLQSAAGGKTETAAMAQWMMGESHFQQEDYEAALKEFLRIESQYPYPHWQAAALMRAGKCYELLGQPEQAAEIYAHLLKRHPQTEFTADASQRLEQTKRR